MPNALIDATSPYLLQHAHNPVDWMPWGDAAFARAKAEDKPIFLSIGYSTCHWCHVMERESFEVEAIAAVMNEHFINVKVDREERPDIDATYMAYVQASTGQGGWPMSVWLTPDGKPIVGGTYFPPVDSHGRAGFPRICEEIGKVWKVDRAKMADSAERVMQYLREQAAEGAVLRGLADDAVFGNFIDRCESMFDGELGGFGGAPKFPRPVIVRALMQLCERFAGHEHEAAATWEMTDHTLRAMAAGGMHDQLGGGFHRYSVDRYWHIPHYEKMLYDQAQLALAYLEAWQIGKHEAFRETAVGIFDYVLRDMRDAGGAFHAAEDADSLPSADAAEKREGAYWVWTAEEISKLLDAKSAAWFCAAYGVEAEGNARPESDPHGELEGTNTLFMAMSDQDLAERFCVSVEELRATLNVAKDKLLEERKQRPLPHRDDKIVTAWNGLMMAALARGARVLDRPDLAQAARSTAAFLKRELWDGARLFRSYRKKRGDVPGFAIDYAAVICGLLELEALSAFDGGASELPWIEQLQSRVDADCWDATQAGYLMRVGLEAPLLAIREDYDGAEPAANHVMAENLLKLAALTGKEDYATRAEAVLRRGSRVLETQAFAAPVLLGALDLHQRGVAKLTLHGDVPAETISQLRSTYLPRAVYQRGEGLNQVIVCEGETCRPWS